MSRRTLSLLVVIGCVGVLGWFVTRTDEPEPCRQDDGCVAGFTVQLDALGLLNAEPSRTALAARSLERGVFVAAEGRRSDESERSDRIVVVEVSPETGVIERVLLDRSGRTAVVDAFVASPDGTLVGIALVMVEDDGSESRHIVVIDVTTGAVVSTAVFPDLARSCLLSFSADNTRTACSGRVFDVESGELLGGTEDFEPIDLESRWVRMGFRTALDVEADPDDAGNEIRLRFDGEERTFVVASPSIDGPGRGQLSFRPDGARLIHHRWAPDADQAEIVVYRTNDQAEVGRILRNDPVHDMAWLDDDLLVTITADFQVVIYEID